MKSINATKLAANDAIAKDTPGEYRMSADGKIYRYVQALDIAVADGYVVENADAANSYKVSIDRAGGSSIGRIPAGVGIGAITKDYYGWVLVRGVHNSVLSDGSVAAGEAVVPHASVNGSIDTAATGSTVAVTGQQLVGYALADDTTSRAVVDVRIW
jgi:hypothetical protein